jgi:hypothetical protein
MNWEPIGAIGQILGAAAVFISLGYLAVQLKIANVTARLASQNAFVGTYQSFLSDFLNAELIRIAKRGFLGFDGLDEDEKEQFHTLECASHLMSLNLFQQARAKQFDRGIADPFVVFFASTCKTKGGNYWWTTYKHSLSWDHEFTDFVDSMVLDPHTPALNELQPWWGEAGESVVAQGRDLSRD